MMTENKLYQAFDLQRFASNKRLSAVINKSHARMASRELSDAEMEYVSAAGIPELPKQPDPHKDPHK